MATSWAPCSPPTAATHRSRAWSTTGRDRPLCGDESAHAVCTDDPNQVVGCTDCLELAAEDLEDSNRYAGRYLHCQETISAVGGVAWRRAVRQPCPHCGRAGW